MEIEYAALKEEVIRFLDQHKVIFMAMITAIHTFTLID
jgi:hypothetical protein